MKKLIAAVCLSAASICAADLTGAWACDVQTDMGSGNPTFDLKQSGNKVTGKYAGALGEANVTGTVDGSKFELTFNVDAGAIKYMGEVNGNESKGKVDLAGGQASGTYTDHAQTEDHFESCRKCLPGKARVPASPDIVSRRMGSRRRSPSQHLDKIKAGINSGPHGQIEYVLNVPCQNGHGRREHA